MSIHPSRLWLRTLDPLLAAVSGVVATASVTSDEGGKRVANDESSHDGSPLGVVGAKSSKAEQAEDQDDQLVAYRKKEEAVRTDQPANNERDEQRTSAHESGEEKETGRRAEDVALDLLPAGLVTHVLIPGVGMGRGGEQDAHQVCNGL